MDIKMSSNLIKTRVANLREAMAEKNIDTLLVLVEENRRYLSGFTGEDHQYDESAGALLISARELILATDSRFEIQAATEAPLYEVVVNNKGLAKELPSLLKRLATRRLGFESNRVSVHHHHQFQKELTDAAMTVTWLPLETFVEHLRIVKTSQEIEATRHALALAEAAYQRVVKTLKPGMTEKAVAWAMESEMRQAGADALSFPVIVAAGPNSALPHAIPSQRPINATEPILFDWGAKLNGYCSDTSRTVVLGRPDDTFLKVYHTVLEAQNIATAAIKAGVSSKMVDGLARDHIHRQGFEGKFGHGLGHGTGLAVHEGPRLSPLKEMTLARGMLVTVEPGIYLADWGGVRIENQVMVEKDGPLVLNQLSTSYAIDQI
jgi:Xaa-Pro aminopeptidase